MIYHPKVTEVYVICYSSALTSGGAGELPTPLNDIILLKNSLAVVNDMRVDLFAGAIDIAQDSTIPTYLYIPALNQSVCRNHFFKMTKFVY